MGIVELIIMSLDNVYYVPKHPAVFDSVAKLVKASKYKEKDVEDWLSSQNTYICINKFERVRVPRVILTL